MNLKTALKEFVKWDKQGRYLFTNRDIARIFFDQKPKTLQESLNRLVRDGILERPCRGIYIFAFANSRDNYVIENIARSLRRGKYNYVSLESALSEYGAISQISLDRLTIMTTGRSGEYKTPYGVIEFTHTKRTITNILDNTQKYERPLAIANAETAWRDLKRVGRNTHLVNIGELDNE